MRDTARTERHEQIMAAAYRVMEAKGFAGLSVLAVARAAKASNETLYRWYGDKAGLFTALIAHNSGVVEHALQDAARDDPADALSHVGAVLLAMLLGPRAVALNRAAAADPTGALGTALAKAGRNTIKPLIEALMTRLNPGADADEMAEAYLSYLIGDLQIRRVTGAMPPLSPVQMQSRANLAVKRLQTLYPLDVPAPLPYLNG